MKKELIACFNEFEEMNNYIDMIMEDPELIISILGGQDLEGEKNRVGIERLKEKYKTDYDRMFEIIDRLGLKDVMERQIGETIDRNDNCTSDFYENFFEDVRYQLKEHFCVGLDENNREEVEEELFMIISSSKSGYIGYSCEMMDSDSIAEKMDREMSDDMSIYKTSRGFEFWVEDCKLLDFIRLNGQLSKKVRHSRKELQRVYSLELKYLGLDLDNSKETIVRKLLLEGIIDPFYDDNVKKGIYPIS